MRTTTHRCSARDLARVPELIAAARGAADTGKVLLGHGSEGGPAFASRPVRTGVITSEWVAAPGCAAPGAIIYLHARRFQFDEPSNVLANRLSATTGFPVLHPHYRLAPANPYPAAVDDALAAYRTVLKQGIPAGKVVLVGHSAGATLVLQVLNCLEHEGLPKPAAAVAISPITDFTFGAVAHADAARDVVRFEEATEAGRLYVGTADPAGPVSPLFGMSGELPPLLLMCGTNEILLDDTKRYAEAADAKGADVTLELFEGMPHGFPVVDLDSSAVLLTRVAEFAAEHVTGCPPGPGTGELAIQRVGWAGYVVTTERGTRVLVDPYLDGAEGLHRGLPASPINADELTDVDAVLVTHAGYDHRGQAIEIAKAGNATLICGQAMLRPALDAGIPWERISLSVSGVRAHLKDVSITALPARHESSMTGERGFVCDQPQSFLLATADGGRVFCGGDTSLSGDLRTWGELYRPHVAVLGIGGVWVGAAHVVELPPDEAAVAARWLGVRTVVPVHHFDSDPAPAQLLAELADDPIEVIPLAMGETWKSGSAD